MFNFWHIKQMPFRGLTGFGGGSTGLASSSGDAWEEAGITATGGTVVNGQENPDGTPYTWHVFPGGPRGPVTPMPYTFSVTGVTGPGKIEYIMVGGGGMGGISPNPDPGPTYKGAGGGGAGGVICNFQSPPANPGSNHPFYPLSPGAMTVSASPGSYAIEVGRAAAGFPAPERSGKDTTFNGLTAKGGGYGGHANSSPTSAASSGGSGGGGGSPPGNTTGAGPNAPTQGKSGGDGENASAGGGGGAESGGGGASGAGGEGIMFDDAGYFKLGPVGGIADDPTQPTYRYLAGGGGGGGPDGSSIPPGKGGYGGGGEAGNPDSPGGNADNWSGAGGGGAGGGPQTRNGGQGGQGMLFIRYIKNS
jgi:hypothetical protein